MKIHRQTAVTAGEGGIDEFHQNLRLKQMIAHEQYEGVWNLPLGSENGQAVRPAPLFVVKASNAQITGSFLVKKFFENLPAVPRHHCEVVKTCSAGGEKSSPDEGHPRHLDKGFGPELGRVAETHPDSSGDN